MTKLEATKLTAVLAELYDQPGWTEERIKLFAEAIIDLEYVVAQRAVTTWMQTRSQRPQPADIRKLVAEATLDLPEPEEAYGLVHARFASHGPTDLPQAILDAVALTGRSWEDLAYLDESQYPWFRRDFLNAYREVRARVVSGAQQQPAALPDRHEARQLLDEIRRHNGQGA